MQSLINAVFQNTEVISSEEKMAGMATFTCHECYFHIHVFCTFFFFFLSMSMIITDIFECGLNVSHSKSQEHFG